MRGGLLWLSLICLCCVAAASGGSAVDVKTVLLQDFDFYHTTDQIHHRLNQLSQSCPDLTLSERRNGSASIDVVTVRKKGVEPINRVFMLFGEHARELISPETGLYMIEALCQSPTVKNKKLLKEAKHVLESTMFSIVVNGNPQSRRRVEEGEYCVRVNEHGVDLNRNWDDHWTSESNLGPDTNPGAKPFSEPETAIFLDLVKEVKTTTFVTIHSGTFGMYQPWAYEQKEAPRNAQRMSKILRALDAKHCTCPFGAAAVQVGYPCPGTSLDFVYDKLDPPANYAFAFEIYTSPSRTVGLKERYELAMRKQSTVDEQDAASFVAVATRASFLRKKKHKRTARARVTPDGRVLFDEGIGGLWNYNPVDGSSRT
uniref:Peptidase M14 domain-containing protein n=1 Tax=Vitrella brassicaformis TaxID=1169539 RepID=A0A6U4BW63_9ALVE|mmetsp:Transcript_22394/g.55188  ORF Transcript_22394/g.55188 Transcript_22394/m.55188 type:complete len:371 (+) Transcript_22394:422-1534(+)